MRDECDVGCEETPRPGERKVVEGEKKGGWWVEMKREKLVF